jgi:hypothetical protein
MRVIPSVCDELYFPLATAVGWMPVEAPARAQAIIGLPSANRIHPCFLGKFKRRFLPHAPLDAAIRNTSDTNACREDLKCGLLRD